MQPRHGFVQRVVNLPARFLVLCGKERFPEHAPIHHFHDVEHGADDAFILAEAESAGRRKADAVKRGDDLVFAVNRMGGGKKLPRRLAAQHIFLLRRRELISRVRLPALELRYGERPLKAFDMRLHILFKALLIEFVALGYFLRAGELLLTARFLAHYCFTPRFVRSESVTQSAFRAQWQGSQCRGGRNLPASQSYRLPYRRAPAHLLLSCRSPSH